MPLPRIDTLLRLGQRIALALSAALFVASLALCLISSAPAEAEESKPGYGAVEVFDQFPARRHAALPRRLTTPRTRGVLQSLPVGAAREFGSVAISGHRLANGLLAPLVR